MSRDGLSPFIVGPAVAFGFALLQDAFIDETAAKYEDLKIEYDAVKALFERTKTELNAEIERLRAQIVSDRTEAERKLQDELESLDTTHRSTVSQLNERIFSLESQATVLAASHAEEINSLESERDTMLQSVRSSSESTITSTRNAFLIAETELKQQFDRDLETMRSEHSFALNQQRSNFVADVERIRSDMAVAISLEQRKLREQRMIYEDLFDAYTHVSDFATRALPLLESHRVLLGKLRTGTDLTPTFEEIFNFHASAQNLGAGINVTLYQMQDGQLVQLTNGNYSTNADLGHPNMKLPALHEDGWVIEDKSLFFDAGTDPVIPTVIESYLNITKEVIS